MGGWKYCDCAGSHKPGCPNGKPGGLPPLKKEENEDSPRKGNAGRRGGRRS